MLPATIRKLTAAACLLLFVFVFKTRLVHAFDDADGDGIDDALENELAERFFPAIHYSGDERCAYPLPRPFVFRARYPSVNGFVHTDYMLINYVQLYAEDCGTNGHEGDNEAFETFLHWNGDDWEFYGISATAHWDAVCETQTSSGSDALWIGNDKHGTYTDPCACGCFGGDNCQYDGPGLDHTLFNVGEPDAHLIDELDVVFWEWYGQFAWSGNFFDAGSTVSQLYNDHDHFFVGIPTPEWVACDEQCEIDYPDCEFQADWDECITRRDRCHQLCYENRPLWDR
jgi:hypothetical protein